jgi:hypothetical protein
MRGARLWFALVAVATAGAIAACGGQQLDTSKLETEIKSGIERQTDVKMRSVECPKREVKVGDSFDCKATATDGDTANVKVTQQDDEGNVRWRLGR